MRSRSLVILALTAAPAFACAQEAVLLRVGGQQGQSMKYRSVVETYMQGGPMAAMGGDPSQPMTRMTIHQTRTLTAVSGDTLTFSEVIDSATNEMPAMPQAAAFAGRIGEMMRGMTTITKMDRRARIFDIEVSGGPAAMMGGPGGPGGAGGAPGGMGGPGGRRGGMGGGMGGGGGGNSGRNMVFLLPEGRVRAGDTWSDSMVIEGQQGQPNSVFRATFRLERVERGVAVVSINGSMDMPMQGQVTTMQTTGEFQLELGPGRLREMSMTMAGTVRSQQGDMPMRMVMTTQAL